MRFWTVKFNLAANRREKGILKMYITYELLKEKGACSNGLNWFKQNFPEGCELNEETVARVKKCDTSFVWWFYNNIQQDKRLYKLCGVNRSDGVNISSGVNRSSGVNMSDGVNGSNGVNTSNGVNRSFGVNMSDGVNGSNGVNISSGVNRSSGVNMSDGVNGSNGVNRSFGILNSYGVDCALFLANKKRVYLIFGKEVSEGRYLEVKNNLYEKLGIWEPNFNNIKTLYLKNGSDWKLTPIKNAEEIARQEAWRDMPREAVEYVASLPEFDADMFFEITCIDLRQPRRKQAGNKE